MLHLQKEQAKREEAERERKRAAKAAKKDREKSEKAREQVWLMTVPKLGRLFIGCSTISVMWLGIRV